MGAKSSKLKERKKFLRSLEREDYRKLTKYLNRGIDVNRKTRDGVAPMHRASFRGMCKMLRTLKDYGADTNVKDEAGWTPLHCAVYGVHPAAVEQLIEIGANVDEKNLDDMTPLGLALDLIQERETKLPFGDREGPAVVQTLVRRGSNPNLLKRHHKQALLSRGWMSNPDLHKKTRRLNLMNAASEHKQSDVDETDCVSEKHNIVETDCVSEKQSLASEHSTLASIPSITSTGATESVAKPTLTEAQITPEKPMLIKQAEETDFPHICVVEAAPVAAAAVSKQPVKEQHIINTSTANIKACFLGDAGVGKTSLLDALVHYPSKTYDVISAGASCGTIGVVEEQFVLSPEANCVAFECGGNRNYAPLYQTVFSDNCIYVIVVPMQPGTNEEINCLIPWLQTLTNKVKNPAVLIVGTYDNDHSDAVDWFPNAVKVAVETWEYEQISMLGKELKLVEEAMMADKYIDTGHPMYPLDTDDLAERQQLLKAAMEERIYLFPDVITVNLDTKDGIRDLKTAMEKLGRRQLMSGQKSWSDGLINLQKQLALLGKTEPIVTWETFASMAKDHILDSDVPLAQSALSFSGHVLVFSELPDHVIINPAFAIKLLSTLFHFAYNSPTPRSSATTHGGDFLYELEELLRDDGVLDTQLLSKIWRFEDARKDHQLVILTLLEKFDLCYELPSRDSPVSQHENGPLNSRYYFPLFGANRKQRNLQADWLLDSADVINYSLRCEVMKGRFPDGFLPQLAVKVHPIVQEMQEDPQRLILVMENREVMVSIQSSPSSMYLEVTLQVQRVFKHKAKLIMQCLLDVTQQVLLQHPGIYTFFFLICANCLEKYNKGSIEKTRMFPAETLLFKPEQETIRCETCSPDVPLALWQAVPSSYVESPVETSPETEQIREVLRLSPTFKSKTGCGPISPPGSALGSNGFRKVSRSSSEDSLEKLQNLLGPRLPAQNAVELTVGYVTQVLDHVITDADIYHLAEKLEWNQWRIIATKYLGLTEEEITQSYTFNPRAVGDLTLHPSIVAGLNRWRHKRGDDVKVSALTALLERARKEQNLVSRQAIDALNFGLISANGNRHLAPCRTAGEPV